VHTALADSLRKLNRPRADLLLLHWPDNSILAGNLAATWRGLEEAKASGTALDIGVCNCTAGALRELLSVCSVKPAVNQVERHPRLPQVRKSCPRRPGSPPHLTPPPSLTLAQAGFTPSPYPTPLLNPRTHRVHPLTLPYPPP